MAHATGQQPLQSSALPFAPVALTATGRQRAAAQDPLKPFGRHFARTVDMFVLPVIVIQAGMEYDLERSPDEYTPEQHRNFRSWETLLRMIPNLAAMLVDPNAAQPVTRVGAALLSGSNAARSDDTRSIKIAIVEWLSSELAAAGVVLHPKDKTQRGFGNPVTGRLLCPIELNYDDDNIRKLLETHQATIGGIPVNGSHWPKFAFDEHQYNPQLPWLSFLRGRLLLSAFRHIFLSPSSATRDDTVNENRGTRAGNAAIHGMTKVTPGSIIYCATQVHFALSSTAVFNKNNKNNNTITFQRSLVEYFENPSLAAPVAELLDWWNRCVFFVCFRVLPHDYSRY
ncbi:hypothetical protein C2E23DRAFT_726445 [Lenzites betulinus]|nr:hypothetical protein C2E23DRAFT_726445 [Lenzites betulinus]